MTEHNCPRCGDKIDPPTDKDITANLEELARHHGVHARWDFCPSELVPRIIDHNDAHAEYHERKIKERMMKRLRNAMFALRIAGRLMWKGVSLSNPGFKKENMDLAYHFMLHALDGEFLYPDQHPEGMVVFTEREREQINKEGGKDE